MFEGKTKDIVDLRIIHPRTIELSEYKHIQNQCPVLASTGCTRDICQSGSMIHTDEPRIGENRNIASVKADASAFLKEMVHAGIYTPEQYVFFIDFVFSEIYTNSRNGLIRDTG